MDRLPPALRLLGNRNVLLVLAFVLGLLVGPVPWFGDLTLPALALVMMAAATQVPSSALVPPRRLLRPTLLALACTYGLSAAVTLLAARLLFHESDLWVGFVLVAAAPPGVAVLPFAGILGGDTTLALLGTAGAYLAALVMAPLMAAVLVGPRLLQPARLAIILVELVLIPLLVSRLFRHPRLLAYANRWRSALVNWGFFVVIFTVVALSRDVFLRQPQTLLLTTAVAVLSVFGTALVVERTWPRLGFSAPEVTSLALFAAIKNSGFAAATALALVGDVAAVPGAVVTVAIVAYLIYEGLRADRERR